MKYEYRVIPSPIKGMKAQGVKTPEERFAHSIEHTINDMASDNWEYVRAETLPAEERVGLTSKVTRFHNMLVFRREVEAADDGTRDTTIETVSVDNTPAPPVAAAPQSEAVQEPKTAPSEKVARDLVATPSLPAVPRRPQGQMAGILRTIKGDPVSANRTRTVAAHQD
ncbi:MAG: DUF4177 domain-containing protein [Pseudomonadota bacterium]